MSTDNASTAPVHAVVMPLGTRDNPHRVAPPDWDTNGVEYGAFCVCGQCGFVGRSTISFDYYAVSGAGSVLRCETCQMGTPFIAVKPVMDALESEGAFEA